MCLVVLIVADCHLVLCYYFQSPVHSSSEAVVGHLGRWHHSVVSCLAEVRLPVMAQQTFHRHYHLDQLPLQEPNRRTHSNSLAVATAEIAAEIFTVAVQTLLGVVTVVYLSANVHLFHLELD